MPQQWQNHLPPPLSLLPSLPIQLPRRGQVLLGCVVYTIISLWNRMYKIFNLSVKKIVTLRNLGTDGASTQDREGVNATTKMAASTAFIIITTISSNTTPTSGTGTVGMC